MSDLDQLVSRDLAALASANRHHPRALDDLLRSITQPRTAEVVALPVVDATGAAALAPRCVNHVVLAAIGLAALVSAGAALYALFSKARVWGTHTVPTLAISIVTVLAVVAWLLERVAVRGVACRSDAVDRRLVRLARLGVPLAIAGFTALACVLGMLLLVNGTGDVGRSGIHHYYWPNFAVDVLRARVVDASVVASVLAIAAFVIARPRWRSLVGHRAIMLVGLGLGLAVIVIAIGFDVDARWTEVAHRVPSPYRYNIDGWDQFWTSHTDRLPSDALRRALIGSGGLAAFLVLASVIARRFSEVPRLSPRDDVEHATFVREQISKARHGRTVAACALLVVTVALLVFVAKTYLPDSWRPYTVTRSSWLWFAALLALVARTLVLLGRQRTRPAVGRSSFAVTVAGVTSFVVAYGVIGFVLGSFNLDVQIRDAVVSDRIRDLFVVVPLVCVASVVAYRWSWLDRPAAVVSGCVIGAMTLLVGFTYDVGPIHETIHAHRFPSSALRTALTASGTVAVFLVVGWAVTRYHRWEDGR
jgi:hypothetical protein